MSNCESIEGRTFGKLTAVSKDSSRVNGVAWASEVWLCQCECGKRLHVSRDRLDRGIAKSCGCSWAPGAGVAQIPTTREELEMATDAELMRFARTRWHSRSKAAEHTGVFEDIQRTIANGEMDLSEDERARTIASLLEPIKVTKPRKPYESQEGRARGVSYHPKRGSKRQLEREALANPTPEHVRPKTRGDCLQGENAERPCPFVSCKHHAYLEVSENGTLKISNPAIEVWEMQHSCTLDVADEGGQTLEEVGIIANLTRERVRQIEMKALAKLKQLSAVCELAEVYEEGSPEAFINSGLGVGSSREGGAGVRTVHGYSLWGTETLGVGR